MSESLLSKCDLRSAECPCCLKIFEPPIYMCISGHSLCKNCSQNVENCPLCRKQISTIQRNYQLEDMVNSLIVKCEICNLMVKKFELDEHATKICKYRPFKCTFRGCEILHLDTQKIFSHYADYHKFKIATRTPWIIQFDILEYKVDGPRLVKFDEAEFLANFYKKSNQIFIWVAFIRADDTKVGSRNDSRVDNYRSVFKIYKSDPKKVGIMFKSKVYSIRDTLDQLESKILPLKIDVLEHQLDLQDTKSVFWIDCKIEKK